MAEELLEKTDLQINHQLLFDEILCLPKSLDEIKDLYFPEYIKSIFFQFKIHCKKFVGESKKLIDQYYDYINFLCDSIEKAVIEYYNGKINRAYFELKQALDTSKKIITNWKEPFIPLNPEKKVYRARIDELYHSIHSYEEMFHVPLQLRGKIASLRYSIPGFPCLYLGSSTFVCWQELDYPDINKVQFSKLLFDETKCTIINLATFPVTIGKYTGTTLSFVDDNLSQFKSRYIDNQKMIAGFITMWPLIFACSIIVKNKKDLFKPEYIIPQILLQWAVEEVDIDAIKFFSINLKKYSQENEYISTNYVFPIKNSRINGFCPDLIKKFKITLPINFQNVLINFPWLLSKRGSFDDKKIEDLDFNKFDHRQMSILYLPNRFGGQAYIDTIFGKIEDLLDLEKLYEITNK